MCKWLVELYFWLILQLLALWKLNNFNIGKTASFIIQLTPFSLLILLTECCIYGINTEARNKGELLFSFWLNIDMGFGLSGTCAHLPARLTNHVELF